MKHLKQVWYNRKDKTHPDWDLMNPFKESSINEDINELKTLIKALWEAAKEDYKEWRK